MSSLGDWATEVYHIEDLECLLDRETGKDEQFSIIWTSWFMFRYSSDF